MDTKTLARHRDKIATAIRQRDNAIRQAHTDGMSLRQIADAVGVSHMTVSTIVKRPAKCRYGWDIDLSQHPGDGSCAPDHRS